MAEPITTAKIALQVGHQVYKHRKGIVITAMGGFFIAIYAFMAIVGGNSGNSGTAKVNQVVMGWKPVVVEYAEKYEVPEYVDVILAIIMVESGGEGLDIMQSSESLGLPPNTLTDPIASIDAGVSHFASVIKNARSNELDFWTPVQSYNYGSGFNNFIRDNGKQYSFDLASEFASSMAGGETVKYSNPVADFNGNFRYAYGNMYYVKLVQQYLSAGNSIGNADASALGPEVYTGLMAEVQQYDGWSYVWGGASPSTGFDCSGLVQHSYGQFGYNLPRTAAQQHQASLPVSNPQPGDLIFFSGTNPARPAGSITHVGIYIDETTMFDANNNGVGFSTWSQGYWKSHFAGFGRPVK